MTIPFHAGTFALTGLTLTLTTGMAVVGPKGVLQTECPINPKKFTHFNMLLSSYEARVLLTVATTLIKTYMISITSMASLRVTTSRSSMRALASDIRIRDSSCRVVTGVPSGDRCLARSIR